MVVTTLSKRASPLIRYRTRDLTRLIPGDCPCGVRLPRHERLLGRSDDMFIIKGVNIYPGQIASVLEEFKDVSSEYMIHLTRKDGRDRMLVRIERGKNVSPDYDQNLSLAISEETRKHLLVRGYVEIIEPGSLPRSQGKTKRVLDERDKDEE